jgi:hypothetical protein
MAYFSNGSEGEVLDEQCADCPLGAGWNDPNQMILPGCEPDYQPCPVHLVQLTYNYDQIGNDDLWAAMNMLVSKDGVCQVREQLKNRKGESCT